MKEPSCPGPVSQASGARAQPKAMHGVLRAFCSSQAILSMRSQKLRWVLAFTQRVSWFESCPGKRMNTRRNIRCSN